MAVNLGAILSIYLRLIAHNLSHSIVTTFLDGPYANINSTRVSTKQPLLIIPLNVGNRGSFHPSTILFSTNQANFLLEKIVLTKFNLEN